MIPNLHSVLPLCVCIKEPKKSPKQSKARKSPGSKSGDAKKKRKRSSPPALNKPGSSVGSGDEGLRLEEISQVFIERTRARTNLNVHAPDPEQESPPGETEDERRRRRERINGRRKRAKKFIEIEQLNLQVLDLKERNETLHGENQVFRERLEAAKKVMAEGGTLTAEMLCMPPPGAADDDPPAADDNDQGTKEESEKVAADEDRKPAARKRKRQPGAPPSSPPHPGGSRPSPRIAARAGLHQNPLLGSQPSQQASGEVHHNLPQSLGSLHATGALGPLIGQPFVEAGSGQVATTLLMESVGSLNQQQLQQLFPFQMPSSSSSTLQVPSQHSANANNNAQQQQSINDMISQLLRQQQQQQAVSNATDESKVSEQYLNMLQQRQQLQQQQVQQLQQQQQQQPEQQQQLQLNALLQLQQLQQDLLRSRGSQPKHPPPR